LRPQKKLVANTAKSIRQTIPKIELEEIVIEGFPKEDILNYAKANDIDLMILGSHGRTEIGRLFFRKRFDGSDVACPLLGRNSTPRWINQRG